MGCIGSVFRWVSRWLPSFCTDFLVGARLLAVTSIFIYVRRLGAVSNDNHRAGVFCLLAYGVLLRRAWFGMSNWVGWGS